MDKNVRARRKIARPTRVGELEIFLNFLRTEHNKSDGRVFRDRSHVCLGFIVGFLHREEKDHPTLCKKGYADCSREVIGSRGAIAVKTSYLPPLQ